LIGWDVREQFFQNKEGIIREAARVFQMGRGFDRLGGGKLYEKPA
jgi:hypothetical protein